MFRAQFSFGTPPGFKDVPYVRPVTVGQDVNVPIPSGEFYNNYIIALDNDAPSIFRSLFIQGVQQDQPSQIQMQLRDAYGNYLTDGYVPLDLYAWGAGNTPPDGGSGRAKVFEPELYCPAGSCLIADFFNPGGTGAALPVFANAPVAVTTIHAAVEMRNYPSVYAGFGATVGGSGQAAGVFAFGGDLYQVLQYVHPPYPAGGSINIFKSLDGGATWNPLDTANSPVHSPTTGQMSGGVYFDGAHTVTVASTLGEVSTNTPGPILLQDFDLLTGTWGAVYGAGSGNVFQTNQVWKRADGSILVICADQTATDPLANLFASQLSAYVFTGGVWSSFVLTNLLAGWIPVCNSACVLDPATQIIHLFGSATDAGLVHHEYYEQILPTNAVAGFQDLTGRYFHPTDFGNPVLFAGKIAYGVTDITNTFATMIYGLLPTPAFAVVPSPGVNPAQSPPFFVANHRQPVLATDGVTLWAMFLEDTPADVQVWLSVTTDLANPSQGWVGGLVFDDPRVLWPFGGQNQLMSLIGDEPELTIEGVGVSSLPNAFFLGATSPGSLPVSLPPNMELRGIKRYPVRCE